MIKKLSINILTFILLVSGLSLTNKGLSQVYPVQVNLSTSGPYYNYLSYYADENNHLQAVVTLTDFNSGPVQARLRVTFKGPGYEIKTNPAIIVGNAFTLTPGTPVVLSGIDFAPYFHSANIITSPSGIDITDLPEGFTTICIEVIRAGTNQEIISTNNCTSFFLQKFQPPIPTLPTCSSNVDTEQLFYTFQWSPPIGYVPSVGSDLTYTFSLYEWNDPSNYNIFQTGQGLVYTTQTTNTLIQISEYDVVLQEGKDYVWRIEAQLTKAGQLINMFANNGLSTPCSFTYGESQTLEEALSDGLVINLNAEGKGEHKGRAYWSVNDNTPGQGLSTYPSFLVEYRKKPSGNENFSWFDDTVQALQHFIYQLEPNTTYEVKVSGIVNSFISTPSNTAEFTTFETRVYACGEQDMPYLPVNYQPLASANPDMIFNIGQFSMKITEINPTGIAGHYAGKGLIPIQFLAGAKAKVSFDDILVDDQFNVRDGQVNVITRGLENWLHQQYMQFIDPIYVNGSVDSAYVENGIAWVIVDGDTLQFEFDPEDYPVVINDEDGYQYIINPDGTIIINTYIVFSDDFLEVGPDEMVTFAQNNNEVFGFDPKEYMPWHENYEAIQVTGNGDTTTYYVANKSLGVDATDFVDVVFPNNNSGYTFKIDNGSETAITGNTIEIPSFSSKGEHELYIQNAAGQRVGKLNLIVYEEKEKEVIIVPIANATLNQNDIEGIINQTFLEANINVSVTIAPQWNNSTYTPNSTIILPSEVGLLSKYSEDMKNLRDDYFFDTANDLNKDAYYIFVVNGFNETNIDGYMPRGKTLGFVKASSPLLTFAHELSHGIGGVDHSWKDNGPDKNSSTNLMDYNGGINLVKSQWKELRDFDFAPGFWDDDEDGMLATMHIDDHQLFYKWSDQPQPVSQYNFQAIYTPGGKAMKINTQNLANSMDFDPLTGAVWKFNYSGNIYEAVIGTSEHTGQKVFYGYFKEGWEQPIYDAFTLEVDPNDPISQNISEFFLQERLKDFTYYEFVNIMSQSPEYLFLDFETPSPNDKVLTLIEVDTTCSYEIVSVNYSSPAYIAQEAYANNKFKAVLVGNLTGISSYTNKQMLDSDVYIPDAILTPQQAELLCEIIRLYHNPKSWGKAFLHQKTVDLGYTDVTSLLLDNVQVLGAIDRIVKVYDHLGKFLIEDYATEFQNEQFIQKYLKIVEDAMLDESFSVQAQKILAYAEILEAFQTRYDNKMSNLHKETDEDLLVDLIDKSFTNQELMNLSAEHRINILNLLVKDWMFNTAENVAIRVLKHSPSWQSTELLDELIKHREIYSYVAKRTLYHSIFQALYHRINGDQNDPYIACLYKLWFNSDYSNSTNPLYNYDNKLMVIDYTSNKSWGFYNSNYDFDQKDNFKTIIIQNENDASKRYYYHMFQPLGIVDTKQDGEITFPGDVMPAFVFYAFDDINGNANGVQAAELAVDVLSTFVGGIGLLKNLKYIGKLSKLTSAQKINLGYKSAMFTVESANLVLNYTCSQYNTTCQKIQSVLRLVELSSLTGDVIYGQVLKQRVDNIIDDPAIYNDIPNLQHGDELKKLIDELGYIFINETVRGVSKSDFLNSVEAFAIDKQLLDEAWVYFKNENWSSLENLINTNNINGGWPPNNGFKNITHTEGSNDLAGKTFDRFQGYEDLGGSFASPVYTGEDVGDLVFTYDSRALNTQIPEGTFYLKFKFKNNLPQDLQFEYGEAIPWFNAAGNADQIKSNYNFNNLIEGVHYDVVEKLVYQNGQWVTAP